MFGQPDQSTYVPPFDCGSQNDLGLGQDADSSGIPLGTNNGISGSGCLSISDVEDSYSFTINDYFNTEVHFNASLDLPFTATLTDSQGDLVASADNTSYGLMFESLNVSKYEGQDETFTIVIDGQGGEGTYDLEIVSTQPALPDLVVESLTCPTISETFTGESATVIPYGDDIGKATSLNIVEHGINFTEVPTLLFPHYAILKTVSGAITEDETFTSNVSGATGTVVDFTAPLLKYTATTSELEVDDTITFSGGTTAVVAKSDNLTATTAINTRIATAGKYISQDGHLSELTKKIQDSLYYQDFSYVIKVSESISKWRDSIKKATHPTGFYVTGEVNIATQLDVQVKRPVGATLSQGLFSGTEDSPIYMRLNTLFSTFFGRRTGVGLKFMSNNVQLDGKTLLSSAVARAGIPVNVSDDFDDPNTNTEKELNLHPETTIETEQRSRNSFYSLNSYKVRNVDVSNGFAYAGPRQRNLRSPFQRYAHNNGILLEGHTETGDSNIRLENESGVLASEFGISASTTIADWAQLRFTGTLNTSVDGETMRIQDLEGTNSNLNHKNNFAFPTDITQEPS